MRDLHDGAGKPDPPAIWQTGRGFNHHEKGKNFNDVAPAVCPNGQIVLEGLRGQVTGFQVSGPAIEQKSNYYPAVDGDAARHVDSHLWNLPAARVQTHVRPPRHRCSAAFITSFLPLQNNIEATYRDRPAMGVRRTPVTGG